MKELQPSCIAVYEENLERIFNHGTHGMTRKRQRGFIQFFFRKFRVFRGS